MPPGDAPGSSASPGRRRPTPPRKQPGATCAVLDEELERLPKKYRDPLVYCFLEHKTNEEAAQLLGWSKGTLSGRLARAKQLLRGRLSRRGVTLAPAAVGGLPAAPALAPVPAALVQAILQAALPAGAGQAVTAPVAAMVQGALRRLLLARLRLPALALLAICLLGAAAAAVVPPLLGDPTPEPGPTQPAAVQPGFGPVIVVKAAYPGANARVVADTVGAHIEKQVHGVEGMTHMTSQCDHAGNYALTVTFAAGTDPQQAQVRVQNRVTLLQPVLPEAVWKGGLIVRPKAGDVLLFVVLTSDGRQDARALSEVANKMVRGDLTRLPGVGDVQLFGAPDQAVRVHLDPDLLQALNLTVQEVLLVVQEYGAQAAAGQLGQPPVPAGQGFDFTLNTTSPLQTTAELENIPLKTNPEGRQVRIRDVGTIERGPTASAGKARCNGQAAVVLGVAPVATAQPAAVSAAVRSRLAQLREKLPKGVHLAVRFDASGGGAAPGYLRLDVRLPDDASLERTQSALEKCARLLARVDEVCDVLELSGPPAAPGSNQGCVLVGLELAEGGRAGVAVALRQLLGRELPEALVRVGDPARPGQLSQEGYAVALAVHGPDEQRVNELAQQLAALLTESKQLTDVGCGPGDREAPNLMLAIDPEKLKSLGVSMDEVIKPLQAVFGSFYINDFNKFGRTWQINVSVKKEVRQGAERLESLQVRTNKGKLLPLRAVASIREYTCPMVVQRFNGEPMATVTANLAPGVSAAAARAACAAAAAKVLPAGYRLSWLRELPDAAD